jgi:hypothetical protein
MPGCCVAAGTAVVLCLLCLQKEWQGETQIIQSQCIRLHNNSHETSGVNRTAEPNYSSQLLLSAEENELLTAQAMKVSKEGQPKWSSLKFLPIWIRRVQEGVKKTRKHHSKHH